MNVSDLKHYNELRKLVSPDTFKAALTYISWHNRLTMTDMLEVWEALVVAYAYEQRPLDELLFPSVKRYLAQTRGRVPYAGEDCRLRAAELLADLFPKR